MMAQHLRLQSVLLHHAKTIGKLRIARKTRDGESVTRISKWKLIVRRLAIFANEINFINSRGISYYCKLASFIISCLQHWPKNNFCISTYIRSTRRILAWKWTCLKEIFIFCFQNDNQLLYPTASAQSCLFIVCTTYIQNFRPRYFLHVDKFFGSLYSDARPFACICLQF